ncbi:MAG: hypothetical protein CVV33_00250 [Methanomicrobiales archaeon HGW-Methanomicrobiales-4]|nr:MAG: hypothetical protein CVV33_00250 [Methanomicrobiales archaeon HGW-Methanomicrobiales-4]
MYTTEGEYPVLLTIVDPDDTPVSNTDLVLINVTMPAEPVASFVPVPRSGKPPLDVAFVDQSVGVAPLSYNWTFGDNVTSTEQSPRHRYNTSGIYPVSLDILDGNGNGASASDTITVIGSAALLADFTAAPLSGNQPLTILFNDTSSGNPDSWFWQFGDGYFETKQNISHSYVNPGTYDVSLTITGEHLRNTDTKKQLIVVNPTG